MGLAKVFIVGGRSFMYIMKSKGSRIDPWGTPCFNYFYSNISQLSELCDTLEHVPLFVCLSTYDFK
jgi:hypothetical protein